MADSANARLRAARLELGLDQKGLAKMLGVSASTISVVETGKVAVSKKLAQKLQENFQVNTIWLEHGQGEMFLSRGKALPAAPAPEPFDQAEYVRVARYDVSVAAANGAVNYDEAPDSYVTFPKSWLASIGIKGTDCGLLEVTGDSMGNTIRAGSLILVDFSVRIFEPNKIFVIRHGDAVRLKRVLPSIGGVILMGDNPNTEDEIYSGDDANEIAPIGQVRAAIARI